MQIKDVLARRADLSTFLVHLARDEPPLLARQKLESIVDDWRLVARTAYGHAVDQLRHHHLNTDSQRTVCFTETPLEHAFWLIQEIQGRGVHFAAYGVAIPKKQGRLHGINPVWYVDITPGHDWLTQPINRLITNAIGSGAFDHSDIARLTPFIEQMGTGPGYRKEFWWEREWRHLGDLNLPERVIILCPEDEIPAFQARVADNRPLESAVFVDPRWGLEQIIARLAGYVPADTDML